MRLTYIIMACALAAITNCASVHAAPALSPANKTIDKATISKQVKFAYNQRDLPKAIENANIWVQAFPNDYEALTIRGAIQMALGNLKSAIIDLNAAININSQYSPAYQYRSLLAKDLGLKTLCERDAQKALRYEKLDADDPLQLILRVVALDNAGQRAEQATLYNRALQICSANYTTSNAILKTTIHRYQGQNQLALTEINYLTAQHPNLPLFHLTRAKILHAIDKNTEALSEIDWYLTKAPHDAIAWVWRGDIAWDLNNKAEALKSYDRAIKLQPNFETAYVARGLARERLHDDKGAAKDYTAAINLEPRNAYAWHRRAHIRTNLHQYGAALGDYDLAVAIAPNDEHYISCRGFFNRTQKNYSNAISDFTKAININPKNAILYCARGSSYLSNDQYQNAIANCSRSLTLNPRRVHPYFTRGAAYSRLKQYEKALSDLDEAIRLYPYYGAAFGERAVVNKALGNLEEAEEDAIKAKLDANTIKSGDMM